jgi:hypothetical protein
MLRRIGSNLAPNTVRRRVFALCTLSVLIVIVSLAACASPTSIVEPDTITDQTPILTPNPEPALEPASIITAELPSELVPTPIIETMPADLLISDLEINPAEVNPGEQILVTANMVNTGDFEANYTLELKVNGIIKFTTEVTLPAGETGELRVSGGEQVPGTYLLDLNGVTEQFVVRELTETLILSSPDPGTDVSDQDTSGGCGGCGSGSSGQGGCGCSGGSSNQSSDRPSSRGGCGCGG